MKNEEVIDFVKENLGRKYYDEIDNPDTIYTIIGVHKISLTNSLKVLVHCDKHRYMAFLLGDVLMTNLSKSGQLADFSTSSFMTEGCLNRYD